MVATVTSHRPQSKSVRRELLGFPGQHGRVAAGVGRGGDVEHSVPMLSLDDVFNPAELRAWADRLAKTLGRHVGG